MTVDLSPLAAALLPLVQAAVLAAVPLLLVWLRQHLVLTQNATLSSAIADCVGRGAGLTYQMLAAAGGSLGAGRSAERLARGTSRSRSIGWPTS